MIQYTFINNEIIIFIIKSEPHINSDKKQWRVKDKQYVDVWVAG